MNRDFTTLPHERGIKVLQIVWGAMAFSIAVYAAIAWLVRTEVPKGNGSGALILALAGVTAALFITQLKLYQNLSDDRLFPRILDLGSWGLKPEAAEQLKELQVPERGVQLILQAHVIFGIVIWAMAEAVAVFGLILALVNGDPRLMGVFGTAALLQLIWFRPREKAFNEQIGRWHRYVATNRGRWGEGNV